MKPVFRIDDVCANTDPARLRQLIATVRSHVPEARIILAISPLSHDVTKESPEDRERPFPRHFANVSDHRVFYLVRRGGSPSIDGLENVAVASHGLVHVDHRLLGREAQELSIVTSCNLIGTNLFVPPFHKYNADTVAICTEHKVELIKWEDGWRSARENEFDPLHGLWFFTPHNMTVEDLDAWFRPVLRDSRIAPLASVPPSVA